ncbi:MULTISPECIES: hypothetical protein [Auritidibacter]|uniref:Uncharacterized protein n=1 Tax=Auritidibacter ignavus TaxID=678932 RepID=A0AAJ6AFR4_9MICC|nr:MULTISPECIES: hypothetical protein [Auritidibacter]NIH72703.1 hypothetical protein [Auritidibacter ignavus]WGH80960.1 hypothetical protein QDX25_09185 [Auritidibacter ignavus]WGH85564.1 hypothetical protein QDX24_08235 [Auritidibacter ignavus]WGH87852.1 hypothetical protein QDX22_08235 [Auritidibacter ignavus]WGH92465.1 hypothetical protein QDX21_09070 [Auritidibacter ignavus]
MMFGCALLVIGVSDLLAVFIRRMPARWLIATVWWLLTLIGATVVTHWWHAAVAVVLALVWMVASQRHLIWRGPVLVVLLAVVFGVTWATGDHEPSPIVMATGSLVFLSSTGNEVVRSVLELTGRHEMPGQHRPPEEEGSTASSLRGGRIIGPLERIIIYVLALTGAQGIVAALIAAKGIVRFPEISADRRIGARAEEFLIGSLTSWGLAGALAAATLVL